MEVMVSFIKKIGEDETFLLTMGVDVYPSYKAGERIFLQITNKDRSKEMRLTGFRIDEVVHSVRQSVHSVTDVNDYLGVEVYVSELQ